MDFKLKQNVEAARACIELARSARISLNNFLSTLLQFGFTSARYYDCAYDVTNNGHTLVLSAAAGMKSDKTNYRIKLSDSTYGKSGKEFTPVIGAANQPVSPQEEKWIDDLGLQGKQWVDVPIRIDNDLWGLLSCDWSQEKKALSEPDVVFLELMASQLAVGLVAELQQVTEQILDRMKHSKKRFSNEDELLDSAISELCASLNIAAVAVFEHRWECDELIKLYECVNPSLGGTKGGFPEVYSADCTYLTRQAWERPEYGYISNFDSALEHLPHLIERSSLDRHTTTLGPLTSVIYELIGSREPQYMIRAINRTDDKRLPLVLRHRKVLSSMCSFLDEEISYAVTKRRLTTIRRVSSGIVERVGDTPNTMNLIRAGLHEEGINNPVILCHTEDSGYLTYTLFQGPLFDSFKGPKNGSSLWSEDAFYSTVINKAQPEIQNITKFPEHRRPDHFLKHLFDNGIQWICCVPIVAARAKGILLNPLMPLDPRPVTGAKTRKAKMPASFVEMMETYATMIGSAIQSADSYLAAEGARHMVGHIGHEVNTPILTVIQKAIESLAVAKSVVPTDDEESRKQLQDARKEIHYWQTTINSSMDLARMVAQESRGHLQLNFVEYDLYRLLEDSIDYLASEMREQEPEGRVREFIIDLKPSCERLGRIVIDPFLVKQALVNLLRNAMKYSLPRVPKRPMIIEVHGQPQSKMAIIQIANWGLGIPPDEFESIFRPFIRGTIHDRIKAIRGMGLGLYISRRIVAGHEGRLFCRHSRSTLDDPKRIAAWEGFETMFEMRLPTGLTPGPCEHIWEAEV